MSCAGHGHVVVGLATVTQVFDAGQERPDGDLAARDCAHVADGGAAGGSRIDAEDDVTCSIDRLQMLATSPQVACAQQHAETLSLNLAAQVRTS